MKKNAKIQHLQIPQGARIICISDIHGEIDLLQGLLAKVNFSGEDILILLGDIYTKGSQPHPTLKYCIQLHQQPNVHILRGNADWGNDPFLTQEENAWLDNLPDIIETPEYTFVHSGIGTGKLEEELSATVKKYNNFMEVSQPMNKWVVVGHWPVAMYCHQIPCQNPIVNHHKKIISIDGGAAIKAEGQLNAFVIQEGAFSYAWVDKLPTMTITQHQKESGGNLNITYLDRFVDIVEDGAKLCKVKHLATGAVLMVPKSQIWQDADGETSICDCATDYHLPCEVGDVVYVVEAFDDCILAKKDGVVGWVRMSATSSP